MYKCGYDSQIREIIIPLIKSSEIQHTLIRIWEIGFIMESIRSSIGLI